ncbi:MAG: histone deacetylase family protein [Thermodesulfobacteriota bacterium]
MRVVFNEAFYRVYTSDPAAAAGRMETIMEVVAPQVVLVAAEPASDSDIAAVHSRFHIDRIRECGLYEISALAAGGAILAARIGLTETCFGLIRPPGHHASADSSWGFCFFNNMAIALEKLKRERNIQSAYVLDIDLHYGDGTVNIFGDRSWAKIYNVFAHDRDGYLREVDVQMKTCHADIIGISAGFDNHQQDWGGVLRTEDYAEIGQMVRTAAQRLGAGCFAVLEGGYNHSVLGHNVMALIRGLSST